MTAPIDLHPTWPEVRCTRCAHVYMIDTNMQPFFVTGHCPKCACVTFNSSAPIPEGFELSMQGDQFVFKVVEDPA